MEYVLVTITNEGDRERAHPGFRRKIWEALLGIPWLKIPPDNLRLIVLPGSSAAKAGLLDGDEPVFVAGVRAVTIKDFVYMIGSASEGKEAVVGREGARVTIAISKELVREAKKSISADPAVVISFSGCKTVRPGPVTVRIDLPDGIKTPERSDGKWPPTNPMNGFVEALGRSLAGFYFENGYAQRRVEVNVFNAPKPLLYGSPEELLAQLRPGVDGVILRVGDKQAVHSPQAWRDLSAPEVFMSELAAGADLDPRAWAQPGARVSTYQMEATCTAS